MNKNCIYFFIGIAYVVFPRPQTRSTGLENGRQTKYSFLVNYKFEVRNLTAGKNLKPDVNRLFPWFKLIAVYYVCSYSVIENVNLTTTL